MSDLHRFDADNLKRFRKRMMVETMATFLAETARKTALEVIEDRQRQRLSAETP